MSKKKRRRRRRRAQSVSARADTARELAMEATTPAGVSAGSREQASGRFDTGLGLMVRRAASWLVDFVLNAGLVSVFYICAQIFYLDEATVNEGNLMLICAIATLLLLTVWLPLQTGGQSIGERLFRLRVLNRDGSARSWLQLLMRECILKVACGPVLAVLCVLDYGIVGLVVHRDVDHVLALDEFSKTRVVPVPRSRHGMASHHR